MQSAEVTCDCEREHYCACLSGACRCENGCRCINTIETLEIKNRSIIIVQFPVPDTITVDVSDKSLNLPVFNES